MYILENTPPPGGAGVKPAEVGTIGRKNEEENEKRGNSLKKKKKDNYDGYDLYRRRKK
jgi:hypothetical protein